MRNWMLIRSLGIVWVVFGAATMTFAADPLSALDLVSSDAAFCLEIPNLEETFSKLESSPLMDRLRSFPPSQHFFESPGIQRWRTIEEQIASQSGQNLTGQLRNLFAKSLVLAMYVPAEGTPQGILIGEASDPEAIKIAFATWNILEPNAVMIKKSLRGSRYLQRKKSPNAVESLYFASSKRWFAVSDHESLIHDVIERFLSVTSTDAKVALSTSLRRSTHFARNRERLKRNGAAYVHIGARAWDRGLQESSDATIDKAISPAAVWKHVGFVSACLRFDQGIICDTVIEMEKSNLPGGWSQFVSTASGTATWKNRVPSEAIFAFGGRLKLGRFVRSLLSQLLPVEQAEFTKYILAAQSLLSGQELFDVVMPALTRDFRGFVVMAPDNQSKRVILDGMLGFTLDAPGDRKLLLDINQGLETAVKLLAAYFSAETQDVVVVNREQMDKVQICWSSESSPFPIALGTNGASLVVAGSRERLIQSLKVHQTESSGSRLSAHSLRYFPDANQLAWFDVAQTRNLLKANGPEVAKLFARGSDDDAKRLLDEFEQIGPTLELIDSLFMAGRVEYDHVRLTFGGGLDTP